MKQGERQASQVWGLQGRHHPVCIMRGWQNLAGGNRGRTDRAVGEEGCLVCHLLRSFLERYLVTSISSSVCIHSFTRSFIHSFMSLFSQRCGEPVVFQMLFRVQERGGTERPHLGYWSLPFGPTDKVSIGSAMLYLKESFIDRAIPCPAGGVIFGPE